MAESLGSRYVLQEVLGRGAMGQVFSGSIRSTGEQVAIKVLRPELVSDPEVVARFVQERTILMSIADPNVVRVIDLVIEGDTLAIVMELVQGADLRRLLRTRRTLPPSEALQLTGQLLRGMAAVHAAGIIHRDIKPENVLVDTAAGRPLLKLTDFGVARLSYGASLTRLSGVIGTPEYMAPELVEGNRATPAADVYSAGIVLYEMLCGRTPFAGGHPLAVLRRQADQAPPVIPGVPAELWDLITWMLAKDPRSRPASAQAAQAALAPLERSFASRPALAPWAGPEAAADGPDAWARTMTTPGAGRVSTPDRGRTAASATDRAWAAAGATDSGWTAAGATDGGWAAAGATDGGWAATGATVLRHRDRGDVGTPGGPGVPAPWPGAGGAPGPKQTRRKRQALMAVLAVAAAAVLGLVTTVALAATHRTTALTPTAGERTTTVTASSSAQPTGTGSQRVSTSPDKSPSEPTSGAPQGGSVPQGSSSSHGGSVPQGSSSSHGGSVPQVASGNGSSSPAIPTPAVQASVSSSYAALNGYVFVKYSSGGTATVSGQVTNAVSGEVAKLYVQPFPFTSPPAAAAGSAALAPSGTTASYSFTVTPGIATRYTVEVFRDSTATTPLATSAASTVYVVPYRSGSGTTTCTGTQCKFADIVTIRVPAAGLSTQLAGHQDTYFGIDYTTSGKAPIPSTLTLGAGSPVVGTPTAAGTDGYQLSVTYSFSTNSENYNAYTDVCTVSAEAQDGVGLPGSGYGCGDSTIPEGQAYLG